MDYRDKPGNRPSREALLREAVIPAKAGIQ
jgi:hypothetical protein